MNDRPTWLTEPCPPWCTREHREDDHPEDRRHQTERTLHLTVAACAVPREATTGLDVAIGLDRPVGLSATWIRIEGVETATPRLALTPDSARGVLAALQHQLAKYGDLDRG